MDEEYVKVSDLAFYITKEDVQYEANQKLKRKLNYEEMRVAKGFLEWGIMESINIIYDTTFNDIKNNPEQYNEV